jgi:hypothetical protein
MIAFSFCFNSPERIQGSQQMFKHKGLCYRSKGKKRVIAHGLAHLKVALLERQN